MQVHEFSPVADLAVELNVDSTQHLFLISSASLRVASPVWRKTLDPDTEFAPLGTISANGREYRKTTVFDTTVTALTIIFDIFHYRTARVPRSVGFATLNGIALLADEFDFAKALSPWPQFWIDSCLENKDPDSKDTLDACAEGWLFVAVVFSDIPASAGIVEKASKILISHLVVESVYEGNEEVRQKFYRWTPMAPDVIAGFGGLLSQWANSRYFGATHYRKMEVNLELVPQHILDFVLMERLERLTRVLEPMYKLVESMMSLKAHDDVFGFSTANDLACCKNQDCFALALGSLMRSLRRQKIQDLLLADCLEIPSASLAEIVSAVQSLQMTTIMFKRHDQDSIVPNHQRSLLTLDRNYLDPLLKQLGVGDLFVRNTSIGLMRENGFGGPFQVCPLAKQLDLIQSQAKYQLERVPGYVTPAESESF
ncbi:hypothetical protein H072_87 [Dactylellina haptotyla CBS 200.50]|uniref:BTB domain-containing protein n=1 Tax=Dactylellina haptotyla (strain CBS 200.50) TaxID=1284197 RepID=S8C2L5_DACHA|nr:hypothetical protein H072_87 [Dactylellina haptotyla CBS 200.50]